MISCSPVASGTDTFIFSLNFIISAKIVSYFQRQAGDKKAEEEAVNDFGIKIVETWSDKVLEIIKLSEKILPIIHKDCTSRSAILDKYHPFP